MGDLSHKLESVARLRDGRLDEVPFASLLTAIAAAERSAVIELDRTPFNKQIILEQGVPVDCRSNLAHETLGRFLLSGKKLSEEEFSTTLNEAATRGVPHGQVLVDRGLITPAELYRMLQQNLARKLLDPFTWKSGSFLISFEMPEVESPLKVRVPQLVLTGITKFADQREIDRAMNPLIGKTLVRNPSPPFRLEDVKLSTVQIRIMEVLGSGKRVDELAEASQISYEDLARALYALSTLEIIVDASQAPFKEPEHAAAPSPVVASDSPVVPTSSSETQIHTEPAHGDPGDVENELLKLYLDFRKRDSFDLFGLEETAGGEEIDAAWLRYAERWAPWRFNTSPLQKMREKARELFQAGAKAYAVLASQEQRMTLISRRKTLREEAALAPARDRFRIKTDLLDSEQQFRKGKALMDAGKVQEAIAFLEFASDCDHQSGLYLAELAWCRFLQSPMVVTGSKSLDQLQQAMRIDPECGVSWYYAGMIHKQLGRLEDAEKFLSAAIKRMAPDRRPIDALKELRKS